MAKENTKTPEAKKADPFKTVSKNLPFWPDTKNQQPGELIPVFIGAYISETILGDKPDQSENIPVYIFSDMDGVQHFITQSYAISKAIGAAKAAGEDLKQTVFKFDFIGKTESGGKPFNQIDTSYCSLQQYEESVK